MLPPQNNAVIDQSPRRHGLLHPRWWLIAVVAAGLSAVVLVPRVFDTLGLPDYGHWFLDSYAILAANDAVTAGLNPYESIPFDLLKRRHAYSEWWLELRHLGLTRQHNFLFGGGCVLAFLVVAMSGARPRTLGAALGFAAVMLSPPVLLAVNRANNDLVIFAIIGAPLLLFHGSITWWRSTLLAVALIIATGLKYYPIVAIAALVIFGRPSRHSFLLTTVTWAVALAVLVFEHSSLARSDFAFPDSVYLFGSPIIWRAFGMSRTLALALSITVVGGAAYWLVRHGLTRGLRDEGATHERWMFGIGSLLLIGCFLAGTSFAYRLIFSIWVWPWLWMKATTPFNSPMAKATVGLLFLSLWQDGLFCVGIHLGLYRPSLEMESIWRYATQSSNWLLIALLAGWVLDAAMAAARELTRGRGEGQFTSAHSHPMRVGSTNSIRPHGDSSPARS
jgi:hypothetical protein